MKGATLFELLARRPSPHPGLLDSKPRGPPAWPSPAPWMPPCRPRVRAALDEMGTRIDDLESNISELMDQAGVDEQQGKGGADGGEGGGDASGGDARALPSGKDE